MFLTSGLKQAAMSILITRALNNFGVSAGNAENQATIVCFLTERQILSTSAETHLCVWLYSGFMF